MPRRKPLIGITCCTRGDEETHIHLVPDTYVQAVLAGMEALPCPIPACGEALGLSDLLDELDGLLVTGSRSNVQPSLYGGLPAPEGEPQDPARDATTLPLIRAAVGMGVPLLAICRGHQELNVAFGGTLFQRVHEESGFADHRDRPGTPDEMFALAHSVKLTTGGLLSKLLEADEIMVNSLHGQGIDLIGKGLTVEARAPDGLIEAVRVEGATAFALGVQWHPEWKFATNPVSRAIFAALADQARARAARRGR